ncbi:hypothetical protein [Actinophytocola sediminis]
MADTHLSFDTEILALLHHAGHTITEVGVATLHHYTAGHMGTPRDYTRMLHAVERHAARHLSPHENTPPRSSPRS